MSTDTSQPISGEPRPDWDLPEILDIQIRRVPFEPPKLRNFRSALADHKVAVEFLVRTSGPIPGRALGAALFVDDVQVIESQQVDDNLYRFLTFDLERLKSGAPISWGWINASRDQQQRTKFRYNQSRKE